MSASEVFGLGDRAVARKADCETAHEAAESVKDITGMQQHLLWVFETIGPMTDEELLAQGDYISPSGVRSRRAELVAKGLLEFSGEFGLTKAGRRSRIWRVAR